MIATHPDGYQVLTRVGMEKSGEKCVKNKQAVDYHLNYWRCYSVDVMNREDVRGKYLKGEDIKCETRMLSATCSFPIIRPVFAYVYMYVW